MECYKSRVHMVNKANQSLKSDYTKEIEHLNAELRNLRAESVREKADYQLEISRKESKIESLWCLLAEEKAREETARACEGAAMAQLDFIHDRMHKMNEELQELMWTF